MREIRFKNSQDASMYNKGYEQGRADKYQEIVSQYMLLTEKQVAEIRADAIDEIKELAHEDVTTGNMIISLVDVEKLKDNS